MPEMNDIPAGLQMLMGAFLIANKPYFPDEAFHMGMNHYARTCIDPAYRLINQDARVIAPFAVAQIKPDPQTGRMPVYLVPGTENNWSYEAAACYARHLADRNGIYPYCLLNYANNPCIGWRFVVGANNLFEIDLKTGESK